METTSKKIWVLNESKHEKNLEHCLACNTLANFYFYYCYFKSYGDYEIVFVKGSKTK